MFKNTAGQKLTVFAFDSTTNLPKSGDAANITAYVSIDDGATTQLTDTSATEESSTNAKGYYRFDLSAAETNGDKLTFSAKSSTSNIVVLARPDVVYPSRPAASLPAFAPSSSQYLTVGEARDRVRSLARNAQDTDVYADTDIDYAIQHVLQDFVTETRCLRRQSDLAVSSADTAIDASSIADFRAEFALRIFIAGEPRIEIVPHEQVLEKLRTAPATGVPSLIGFSTWTDGDVYPTPDDDYTLQVLWRPPGTIWTAGDDDDVAIELPADLLLPCLSYGATAILQHSEVKHRYASESWQKYERFRDRRRSVGTAGAKISYNDPAL